jgi:hypothetical protein
MSDTVRERFYSLLPALYRARDLAEGQPLRALLAVLESEYQALEEDLQAAYDNWFVDTADLWAVPYLADLLGICDLEHDHHLRASQRRRVANTVAYRRRKGTAATLEHAIADATGWAARVVEFSRLVAVTQHIASPRPAAGRTVDLRAQVPSPRVDPFDDTARTADVRHNDPLRGKDWPNPARRQADYTVDNTGLFFWRLRPYPIDRAYAHRVAHTPAGSFTFDVTGRDTPLFNRPQPDHSIMARAAAAELPIPLTRSLFAADLRAAVAQATDRPISTTYYGPDRALCLWRGDHPDPISPLHVVSADLSSWQPGPGSVPADGYDKLVAVDVELGRILFLGDDVPADTGDVLARYTYGFAADMGGGAYPQQYGPGPGEDLPAGAFYVTVAEGGTAAEEGGYRGLAADGGPRRPVRTLQQALALWQGYCHDCLASGDRDRRPVGVIELLDSGLYGGRSQDQNTADLIVPLPRGTQLSIVAAAGTRPTIRPSHSLTIRLETAETAETELSMMALAVYRPLDTHTAFDRRLELRGLRIDGGSIEVDANTRGQIEGSVDVVLGHCTVMPGGVRVKLAEEQARALRVRVEHSITGPLRLPPAVFALDVSDSIVDSAGQGVAIDGPRTVLERVTVLGETRVTRLEVASDSILDGPLTSGEGLGLLKRTYVPGPVPGTVRREHAQPELALQERAHALGIAVDALPAAEVAHIPQAIRPLFTSLTYGHPAYAQLHPLCPREIRTGGFAGAEMGAFHSLYQPQREESLRRILEEYLPLGQEVSIHYVT